MPGLIDLQTNLRTLSYGSGRGEPYITRPLPAYDEDPGNPYLGADMFGRSGQLQRGLTDTVRLTNYLTNGKGLLFNVKQIALEKSRPKVPYGPKRNFLFSTILAQTGVAGTGIHFDRTNSLNVDYDQKYDYLTRTAFSDEKSNRLTLLYKSKILNQSISPTNEFSITGNEDQTTLFRYGGGPGSVGGIGFTKGTRATNTTKYKAGDGQYKNIFTLNSLQISSQGIDPSVGVRRDTSFNNIANFVLQINADTPEGKRIIGRRTPYSQFNRPTTYGTGDPGEDANLDRSTYYEGAPKQTKGTDKINIKKLYSTEEKPFSPQDDLIKFYIGVVDNNNPENKTYIQFRAYVEGLSDSYSANWSSINYPGRGEEFFKYGGFTRDISFSFKVHVGSRAELFPIYNKLNYLASIMAPDYSNPGFMRGNIVTLTVGDYINDMYGVITGFSYNLSNETSWEIARTDGGAVDGNAAELPTLINVDSFNFKPIHNFIPRTVRDLDNPESRFISLGNALNGKGYGEDKRGL